jgi:flagellar biosynthesis/type III secretory pathway protein FliH
MKLPAHKNLENPPGQIVNPIQTLGDYIKKKEEDMEIVDAPKEETIEDAYLRGYDDGIAEGFQRGVTWVRGK